MTPDSDPKTHISKIRKQAAVVFGLGVLLFIWNFYTNRYFYHDDALISLRYAMNLVTLGDLSWNPGDRVEGYTNFLHLVSVAGLIDLGINPVAASRYVNAIGAVGLLAAIWIGLSRLLPHPEDLPVRMLALVGALGSLSVPVWILGGLETVPAAALLLAGVVAVLGAFGSNNPGRLHGAVIGGVFFALAYLCRPDAVVMNFAAGMGILMFGQAGFGKRLAQCIIVGAIPLAVIALHLIWRMEYYGDVLPNTFHAKVGVDLATRLSDVPSYLIRSALLSLPAVSAGLICAFLIFGRGFWRARFGRVTAFLSGCILAQIAYVVWSGGDHMPAARVLVGTLGPGCLLLGLGLASFGPWMRWTGIVCTLVVLALASVQSRPLGMNPAAYIGTIVGTHINQTWPQGVSIALNTAGSTPYVAQNRAYIDMLGLNDREIGMRENVPIRTKRQRMSGHSKGDGQSVLRRSPDYIILGPAEGRPASDPWFLSDLEIAESPEFQSCYIIHVVELERDASWPKGPAPVRAPLTFTYYERTCPTPE